MFKTFLVKYAEIGIKGKNRYLFEDALVKQMKLALEPVEGEFTVTKEQGRVYVFCPEKYDFDECTKKSSIEFMTKGKFVSLYATGTDCTSFLEPTKGKYSINEKNNEFSLTYGTGITTNYKYQKIDENTLVMIEYRDKNNDGKEDKILNYYQRK